MVKKIKVRVQRVKSAVPMSAATRGATGGRPSKSGTTGSKGGKRKGKGDGSGRAQFV